MAYYNWEDKKQKDNRIIIEGVDLNDSEAVMNKYKELKRKKTTLSLVSFVAVLIIGVIGFDFWNVNFNDGTPVLALKTDVKNGTHYQGLGYEVLVCNDDVKHLNESGKKCYETEETKKEEVKTYKDVLHASLLDYFKKEKLINSSFDKFVINSYTKDGEDEEKGYIEYFMDITYTCNDGGSSCFKPLIERINQNNLLIYVSVDKANVIKDIYTFNDEGVRYNELVANYTEKLMNYLVVNNLLVNDNLRSFKLELLANKGKYNYNGVTYGDAYRIKISYMCLDNTDTCVSRFEDGNNTNLSFEAFMFVTESDEVGLVESINKVK